MKYLLLLFYAVAISVCHLRAQEPCGTDELHRQMLATDPGYARQIEANNKLIQTLIEKNKTTTNRLTTTVTIPVVVHVMHTGGEIGSEFNPTDDQIRGAIDYMNQVYAGTLPGMTPPAEGGGVVNMEIQFALAQRTPSCGVTNGIERVDASSVTDYVTNGIAVGGGNEFAVKSLARWDATKYYNIWVVNKIVGGANGYAYYPGASATVDGTVIIAREMAAGKKTLPHELGHAFFLIHTFSSSCPSSGTCSTEGDMVCDTDPVTSSGTCRTTMSLTNPCTGLPYSINTENNYMAYSYCYTLFTNGQKARTEAAKVLPSRVSLYDPSNLALVPCGSQISFNENIASLSENILGTMSGCRRYTDHTYQMNITAAPSANAIVTLTYGGSAVKGTDYDVTTNGDFTNPSDILTFDAGVTTPRTFTVRLYDDADVESPEKIIIDFSLDNSGGDAIKGNKPTLSLTIFDNDLAPDGTSLFFYPIGTNNNPSGTTAERFFDGRKQARRTQYLYKAAELAAAGVTAGNITFVEFLIDRKLATRSYNGFTMKIGATNLPYLVFGGSGHEVTGMTTVYTHPSLTTVAGWNHFTFSTPFTWDGVSNIAIEMCWDNGVADPANKPDDLVTFFDGGGYGESDMIVADINCSGDFFSNPGGYSYRRYGEKPVIQFGKNNPMTPVETAVSTAPNLHIAPGSNDYFYSDNNKVLLKLGNISEQLGCVTAVLEEAGNTWTSFLTGQRSAKVFHVTPTSNGSTAAYTISLYFHNAELGGRNPAMMRIAKTSAASAAAADAGNTILAAPAITTMGPDITVFTASFTGFSRFFLVDGVSLPVTLADFRARIDNDQNALLSWTTASEFQNSRFEVEMSRDGSRFTRLGTVASQGDSPAEQFYQYVHIKPQPGVTYYRLKQIDLDGTYTYSRIVSVNINTEQPKPFVYPVPAKNKIVVNFGAPADAGKIEIFTSDMKIVKNERVQERAKTKEIDVTLLSKGMYFIRYTSGGTTEILRFIKE